MAGLAFVNPGPAYESLGAFCQLPIRPFWYRLALSWIPRYIIAIMIVGLAGSIYAYVGCEFRSYANLSQNSMQTPMTTTLGLSRMDGDFEPVDGDFAFQVTELAPVCVRRASSIAHDFVSSQRKETAVAFGPTTYVPGSVTPEVGTSIRSLPESPTQLALKRTTSSRPGLSAIQSRHTIHVEPADLDLEGPLSPLTQPTQNPFSNVMPKESVTPTEAAPNHRELSSKSPVERRLRSQRRRIHRQLRLLFVYPLAYTLMWLIPFIHHSMNYSDYWANHPLWIIRLGQTMCFTSMGFIDCFIFSLREKPWRGIQSSDGSVWGSFAVWRTSQISVADTNSTYAGKSSRYGKRSTAKKRSMKEGGHESRVSRVKHSVRTSASDDYTRIAAGQARKRLDLEKVERLAEYKARKEARRSDSGMFGQRQKGKETMVAEKTGR
jgi:hypothetical protein